MEKETKEQKVDPIENKTEGKKSNVVIIVVCVLVVAALAVGAYFLFFANNKTYTPEQVAEKYVKAMSEGNSDVIVEMTDLKGAYAWEKCGKDASKFVEEYNKISDSDVNPYKDEFKKGIDAAMAMLKALGGVNISLKDVEKPEEVEKGLYKVVANMEMEAFGMKQDQPVKLVVYNGKFIGNYSE